MTDENINTNEISEEDYLKKHLSQIENSKNNDIAFLGNPKISDTSKISDLQFFNFNVSDLPCGKFYPAGTVIMVRPAQVKEIQAYSMVDDNNFYDMVEKMNDMLKSCIRIKYSDGKIGSYLEIKDQDRLFLIFLIRELTFQQGSLLTINTRCSCGSDVSVDLKRENFKFYETDKGLDRYFSLTTRSYHFTTINNKEFEITPPTIGLQKAFTEYILKETSEKRSPNMSFLKIIPFTLGGRSSITYEGIKSKLKEFEDPIIMDDISFQFLNSAVDKMTFGIKELVKKCQCGEEVHTEMQFPDGASSIFVIHNAFETYIKK